MKQHKIRAVMKDKMDLVAELSERVGDDFDKDTIHKLRVTIKQLRSFIRLLRSHDPQRGLKLSPKFKRLYYIAGAIRDAQLELDKVRDSKVIMPEYIGKLVRILDQQKKEWHKHYNKKTISTQAQKLMDIPYEPLHPAILENFFKSRIAEVDMISATASPADDQVHRIRKKIKDILYTAKITDKKWSAAKKELKVLSLKKLAKIADAVGDYNDKRITLAHIHSFSSPDTGAQEQLTIRKICAKEKTRLEKEKNKIMAVVRKLLASMKP